jgi:hypothetical protein
LERIAWNGTTTIERSAAPKGINCLDLQADVENYDHGQRDRFSALWPDHLHSESGHNSKTGEIWSF